MGEQGRDFYRRRSGDLKVRSCKVWTKSTLGKLDRDDRMGTGLVPGSFFP